MEAVGSKVPVLARSLFSARCVKDLEKSTRKSPPEEELRFRQRRCSIDGPGAVDEDDVDVDESPAKREAVAKPEAGRRAAVDDELAAFVVFATSAPSIVGWPKVNIRCCHEALAESRGSLVTAEEAAASEEMDRDEMEGLDAEAEVEEAGGSMPCLLWGLSGGLLKVMGIWQNWLVPGTASRGILAGRRGLRTATVHVDSICRSMQY